MKILKDSKIAHYKEFFPHVSFPTSGPSDSFLKANGAVKVSLYREHNSATQKLVPCDPIIEDGFAYIVEVVNKTEEEITSDIASKAARMRAQRNYLLSQTDWRFRSDMNPSQDWIDYCQALRDLPNAEGWPDVEFPLDPDTQISAGNNDE